MTGGGRGFCAIPLRSAWPAYAGIGSQIPCAAPWGTPYYQAYPFAPQVTREEELDYLRGLAQSMSDDLKEIEARIQQIESREEKEKL
jgi:hypothetical protein